MRQTLTLLILTLTLGSTQAQVINNKEAKQILTTAWSYLCTRDSVSFARLWSLNDSASINHRRPHTVEQIYGDFNATREWLDTAITRKLKISHVEVEHKNLAGTDTKYWITAWFKYTSRYEKGFGFYIAYFNDKWVVRDNVSTSWAGGR